MQAAVARPEEGSPSQPLHHFVVLSATLSCHPRVDDATLGASGEKGARGGGTAASGRSAGAGWSMA